MTKLLRHNLGTPALLISHRNIHPQTGRLGAKLGYEKLLFHRGQAYEQTLRIQGGREKPRPGLLTLNHVSFAIRPATGLFMFILMFIFTTSLSRSAGNWDMRTMYIPLK